MLKGHMELTCCFIHDNYNHSVRYRETRKLVSCLFVFSSNMLVSCHFAINAKHARLIMSSIIQFRYDAKT
jgi:hypothetical protein